jgi:hypothetical protein
MLLAIALPASGADTGRAHSDTPLAERLLADGLNRAQMAAFIVKATEACPTLDPTDEMVRVGGVCIDKYEASIWDAPVGGNRITGAIPCSANGQDCDNIKRPFGRRSAAADDDHRVVIVASSAVGEWIAAALFSGRGRRNGRSVDQRAVRGSRISERDWNPGRFIITITASFAGPQVHAASCRPPPEVDRHPASGMYSTRAARTSSERALSPPRRARSRVRDT